MSIQYPFCKIIKADIDIDVVTSVNACCSCQEHHFWSGGPGHCFKLSRIKMCFSSTSPTTSWES